MGSDREALDVGSDLVGQSPAGSLEYLLAAAAWQDSLLQSYRSLLVSSQSILFAIGAGLFVAELSMTSEARAYSVAALLVCVSAAGMATTVRLRQVVLARGRDVNFWHAKIILVEKELPREQRPFTEFKVHQKQHRQGLQEMFLADTDIGPHDVEQLIEKGLGHTRRVVDRNLAHMMLGGWFLLVLGSVGYAISIAIGGI